MPSQDSDRRDSTLCAVQASADSDIRRAFKCYLILIPAFLLAGSLIEYESTYLPWYRFPGHHYLIWLCFGICFVGVLASGFAVAVADALWLEKRPGLFVLSVYVNAGLFSLLMLATALFPAAHILRLSAAEFDGFSRSNAVASKYAPPPSSAAPLFILLSDIHLTSEKRTLEGFAPDQDRFTQVMRRALALSPRYLFLSGDITDRGSPAEWALFDAAVAQAAPGHQLPLALVPGNHDIQGAPTEGVGNRDTYDEFEFEWRFAERTHLFYERLVNSRFAFGASPSSESRRRAYIQGWAATSRLRQAAEIRYHVYRTGNELSGDQYLWYPKEFGASLSLLNREFDALFPLVDNTQSPESVAIVLNSNAAVRPGGSMGLGDIGGDQLDRLDVQLQDLRNNPLLKYLIVALHHAPLRHQTDIWEWKALLRKRTNSDIFEHTFLALNVREAARLVKTLNAFAAARTDVHVILLHGHRHQKYLGKTTEGIWIVEAPALVENESGFWEGYEQQGVFQVKWVEAQTVRSRK